MLFASGQLGIDPATGLFVEGSVKEQTAQAFKNVHAILAEAGYSINDVVKTTVFLADNGRLRRYERRYTPLSSKVRFPHVRR